MESQRKKSEPFILISLFLLCLKHVCCQQCLISTQISSSTCFACNYTYGYNFPDDWPGGETAFDKSECKLITPLELLEVFVSSRECASNEACDGSISSPFDNLIKAFKFGWKKYPQTLKIYLLSNNNTQAGHQFFINTLDFPRGFQYMFRRFYADIHLSPLYCSRARISGCFDYKSPRPIIFIRTQSFFIFVAKNLFASDLIFDGSEIYSDFIGVINKENSRKRICSDSQISGEEKPGEACNLNASLTGSTRNNACGLFNIEIPVECKTCLQGTDKLLLNNTEFKYFYYFVNTSNGLQTSSLISIQATRHSLHLNNTKIGRSFFPNGIITSISVTAYYLTVGDAFDSAVAASKERFLLLEATSIEEYDHLSQRKKFQGDYYSVLINNIEIPFNITISNSSIKAVKGLADPGTLLTYLIYIQSKAVNEPYGPLLTLVNNTFENLETEFFFGFVKYTAYSWFKGKLIILRNKFIGNNGGCFNMTLLNVEFVGNIVKDVVVKAGNFFQNAYGNFTITDNLVTNFTDLYQGYFLQFTGPIVFADKIIFQNNSITNYTYFEGAIIMGNSFVDSNAGILKCVNSLIKLVFLNNSIRNLFNPLTDIAQAKVENDFTVSGNLYENVTVFRIFNHPCFKNITIANNNCLFCKVSSLLEATLFTSQSPFTFANISYNVFLDFEFSVAGFSFSGYSDESGINYFISGNRLERIKGNLNTILFDLSFNKISLVNNSFLLLENASAFSVFSLVDLEGVLDVSSNIFQGSPSAPFELLFKAKDFSEFGLKNCTFFSFERKNNVPAPVYLSSLIGRLLINSCLFEGLSGETTGAILIRLNALDKLLISDCIFRKNSGTELAGDIAVEFTNKIPGFLNNFTLLQYSMIGLRNNSFARSKGRLGGSITVLEESQLILFNNKLQRTSSQLGAGVYLFQSSELISYFDTVVNSSAQESGGFLYMRSAISIIIGFKIQQAEALQGGAIYLEDSSIKLLFAFFYKILANSGGIIFGVASKLTASSIEVLQTASKTDGGAIYIRRGSLFLRNVNISESKSLFDGGAIYATELKDCSAFSIVIRNSSVGGLGIFYLDANSRKIFFIKQLNCESNSAQGRGECVYFKGGVMELEGVYVKRSFIRFCGLCFEGSSLESILKLERVILEENKFNAFGLYISSYTAIITNLTAILTSTSPGFVFVTVVSANLALINASLVWKNIGTRFLVAKSSKVSARNVYLKLNGFSAGISAENCPELSFSNLKFEEAEAFQETGASFYVFNSNLNLYNFLAANPVKRASSEIFGTNSNITAFNCTFIKKKAKTATQDAEIYSSSSNGRVASELSLIDCYIYGNPGVNLLNLINLKLKNVYLVGNEAGRTQAQVLMLNCLNIWVSEVVVKGLSTETLSPVTIVSDNKNAIKVILTKLTVTDSYSNRSGGALSLIGLINASVADCVFLNNACQEDGGAIFINIPSDENCFVKIEFCRFEGNQARFYGNILKTLGIIPIIDKRREDLIGRNKYSSYPFEMRLLLENKRKEKDVSVNASEIPPLNFIEKGEPLNIASGQPLNLTIFTYDHYNNLLEFDERGKLLIRNPPNSDQDLSFEREISRVTGGLAYFKGLVITAVPKKSYYISVSYFDESGNKLLSQEFPIYSRPCLKGEVYAGEKCEVCLKNFYSLERNPMEKESLTCQICDPNSICPGGDMVIPKEGFWRKDENQSRVVKCKIPEACPLADIAKISSGETVFKPSCHPNYKGHLCANCKTGHGKLDSSSCIQCSHDNFYILKYLFIVLATFAITGSQIKSAISIDEVWSRRRCLLKLLMDHCTYLGLVSQFKIDWTYLIQSFLDINKSYISPIPEVMFNFDCFLNNIVENEKKTFTNSILVSLSPFFYGLGCIFFIYLANCLQSLLTYIFRKIQKKKAHNVSYTTQNNENKNSNSGNFSNDLISIVILTCFITFYNLYPRLLLNASSWLRCIEIDDSVEVYLDTDPDIKCWDSGHLKTVFSLALPTLIGWCVLVPLLLFYLTTKLFKGREKKIENSLSKFELIIRFITIDYKTKFYYWDLAIYINKFLFVAITIASNNLEPASQGSLLTLFMMILLLIQESLKPYKYEFINNLFTFSYIICICSGSFATMSSSRNISESHRAVYLAIIIASNILFYSVWLVLCLRKGVDWTQAISVANSYIKRVSTIVLSKRRSKSLKTTLAFGKK